MADVHTSRKAREQQGGDGPSPLALPVILAGTFMVVLDFFIVNVAIPAVQHELDAGTDQVQLIVAGYGLAYACGLITAGRLGDVFGGAASTCSACCCSPWRRWCAGSLRPPRYWCWPVWSRAWVRQCSPHRC